MITGRDFLTKVQSLEPILNTEHPLTDKVLTQFGIPDDRCVEGERVFFDDDMRSAADWQLEQVIEWLKINTEDYICADYDFTYFLTEAFLDDLKKAMRPTTQEDN